MPARRHGGVDGNTDADEVAARPQDHWCDLIGCGGSGEDDDSVRWSHLSAFASGSGKKEGEQVL